MTSQCNWEALEALALGELDSARAREIETHAADCASCKRELAWLRAERELMSRRAAQGTPMPAELWPRIEARISPAAPRASRRAWIGPALVLASAAALLLVFLMKKPQVVKGPQINPKDPIAALDKAEKEYQDAISIMEAEVRKQRPDVNFDVARKKVTEARAAAGSDPEARLAVLDGYATYMHSLLDLEEKRR